MKRILFIISICISTVSFAQSTMKEDIDIIQSVYGKTKKELVAQYMSNLTGAPATAFWKSYDAYEVERKALGKKKMELIGKYADHFETLTDAKADEIAKATLANSLAYEQLFAKYYEITKKSIGALQAAKFIQLEVALQTAVRSEIQDNIPFIGEIDRSKLHPKK